jgi:ABC-2 type transport system permease protein
MHGLAAVFWKELSDHFNSKRFVILFLLVYICGISAIYVAAQTIRSQVSSSTDFVYLSLFTTSGEVLPSFLYWMVLFIPIVAIALGFDAINNERTSGNLSRVLSQPIYRDDVINGKFLAGLATLTILVISITAIVGGMGLRMIGVPPSSEEVIRLFIYVFAAIMYGGFWLSLSILFSLLFDRTATSALASIALWIFMVFFMVMIAGIIANSIVPVDTNSTAAVVIRNDGIRASIDRLSPANLFSEAGSVLLVPAMRTLQSLMLRSEASGMLPNPLSLGQSLILIWPHLVSLIALTAVCFGISYVKFMREEVRSA